ncbi:TPA: coagulase [Staphylococcus aureus]|uniref:coagulase domain-containing protein n=2 Tax=Staphylococcus aureus TaxID=1280 RepID=UPI000DE423A3|nr:coagulase domain-containing protein [Staphylococcus aureus]EGQ0541963.1 coagulase [Staphylococcus aureus]MBH4712208.1 coagulase [Staphylococcus aureus]MBH4717485.1 coagulase [Staphylococcus aureus]MBH4720913.1 coagulase [Staphylococcus aureus]MBH4723041.1 coagulase [Staphylococcus aureus]
MKKKTLILTMGALCAMQITGAKESHGIVTGEKNPYVSKALDLKEKKNKSRTLEEYRKSLDDLLISQEVRDYAGYDEPEYKEAYDKYQKKIFAETDALNKFSREEKRIAYNQKNNHAVPEGVLGLTHERYESIYNALKENKQEFEKEVKEIENKHPDLKRFDDQKQKMYESKLNKLENKALMLGWAFPRQTDAIQDLYNKLDMILGNTEDERTLKQPKNQRMFDETVKDLETIVDEFFTDIGKKKPSEIPMLTEDEEQNKSLAKNLRDLTNSITSNSSQKKTDTQNTGNKELVIKEPTKPLIPTYTEEVTKNPMPSIKQETKEKIIYSSPQRFADLSGETNDFSVSYNSTQSGTTTNSNLVEFEEDTIDVKQKEDASARSQYGPRPQFNKTPKYIKYKDASTGIHEYNDGTFGYEARPRFNKPASTNKYNVTTKQDGTVSYGARPTFNKPSHTNAYNVTTYENGTTTYGPRATK